MSTFQKKCPSCDAQMAYKSKGALTTSLKNNSMCRKCAAQKSGFLDRFATKGKNTGSDNAFYGRHHTEDTKKKLSARNTDHLKTPEFRKTMSKVTSGKNNPMFGRNVFDIWVEKYGLEKATELEQQRKQKLSTVFSGSGNPMYGRPSPQGAGVGWKGWYKQEFFRSLRELCFMIQMDETEIDWVGAEHISITYKDATGNHRTYRPDFLVNETTLIEIKPQRLIDSPNNKLKCQAAELFCQQNGLEYQIRDVEIDARLIRKHIDNGDVKFDDRYQARFEQWEADNS